MSTRIYLSPPHIGAREQALVAEAFTSNWIAPLGPHVDAFEQEFASHIGVSHAAAVSSGTAALHLAMHLLGVGRGDRVFVSTFTFIASVTPALQLGATPVFIDSEPGSWNMDPDLLEEALEDAAREGRLPKAVILVHLYGQSADIDRIALLCEMYGVALVEDAAEALGATYRGTAPGTTGRFGIYSFNGNKIITTSGGGMLVSHDGDSIMRARKLATQAREVAPHYEHVEAGYNYRMSNVLAAIGRGQLSVLEERVDARRRVFDWYRERLGELEGLQFMPEAEWGRSTRWLTCATIDEAVFGASRDDVLAALAADDIEGRPLWKPMHRQPLFEGVRTYGGSVSEELFRCGLCLPSGSALTESDLERVATAVGACVEGENRRAVAV